MVDENPSGLSIVTRNDEENFLREICSIPLLENEFTYDDFVDNLKKHKIPLEIVLKDGNKNEIEDIDTEEIKNTIFSLQKIIDSPYTIIHSNESKVPIEVAKKINHKAITVLSKDSSDWYARTALTVKPKKIVANVNEISIDNYDNRFICTLIERISDVATVVKNGYKTKLDEYERNDAYVAINETYGIKSDFTDFSKKISGKQTKNIDTTKIGSYLSNKIKELDEILRKISMLKRSKFYQELKHKQRVRNPVHKTNNMIFDKSYRDAYKLWQKLNQLPIKEIIEITEEEINENNLDYYYSVYNTICFLATMAALKFKNTNNSIFYLDKEKGIISKKPVIFEREYDSTKIETQFEHNCIINNLTVNVIKGEKNKLKKGVRKLDTSREEKSKEFWIQPYFAILDTKSNHETEIITNNILKKMINEKKISKYTTIPADIELMNSREELSEKVVRRFFSIGDNYYPSDYEIIKKCGNYQNGITIIRPTDIETNMLRFARIINQHMIKDKLEKYYSGRIKEFICPECGAILSKNNDGKEPLYCNKCKKKYAFSYCSICDKEHKNKIFWVKFYNDEFLKKEKITTYYNKKLHERMPFVESNMRETAITFFDVMKKDDKFKLKTICPNCGNVLSEDQKNELKQNNQLPYRF